MYFLVKCYCYVEIVINQRKCEDRAMHFRRGLNNQYSNIRSHVLLMEPIPPIPIFSLVMQQEQQMSTVVSVTNIHSINYSRTTATNNLLCNFCGKYGHTKTMCFRKVGFPTTDARNSKFTYARKLCTYCNTNGHTIDTCYKKHGCTNFKILTQPPRFTI